MLIEAVLEASLNEYTSPAIQLGNGGQIAFKPHHLLGAIYIHLMDDMLGRTDRLIRCPTCAKYFYAKHAATQFCEPKCRVKAHRRKKKGEAE